VFVCLFVVTRPAGTRDRLLLKSVPLPHCILVQNVHVIIIPAGTIAHSSRFGPESTRGPIIATRHPASQAQGKRSPHDLPDLLSGRGLTYEGPYLPYPYLRVCEPPIFVARPPVLFLLVPVPVSPSVILAVSLASHLLLLSEL
jgi:hypothetical protein